MYNTGIDGQVTMPTGEQIGITRADGQVLKGREMLRTSDDIPLNIRQAYIMLMDVSQGLTEFKIANEDLVTVTNPHNGDELLEQPGGPLQKFIDTWNERMYTAAENSNKVTLA